MLTLYVKDGCGFSAQVRKKMQELGLSCTEKNTKDPGVLDDLVARGGQTKTPYLVDSETGIEMYESDLINAYLEAHYGEGS